MKSLLIKAFVAVVFLFLFISPTYAVVIEPNPEVSVESGEIVSVSTSSEGGGEALFQKVEQMADELYQAASRAIIPICVIVLIIGAILGIFVPIARRIGLFAVIAMIVVLWAPKIITAAYNWAR